ncbi:hypothetical protein STENM223S_00404 [Streptomyces tendae]
MRWSAHGAGEKGSATEGAVIREVAASADIVVHTAAVLRSLVRGNWPSAWTSGRG